MGVRLSTLVCRCRARRPHNYVVEIGACTGNMSVSTYVTQFKVSLPIFVPTPQVSAGLVVQGTLSCRRMTSVAPSTLKFTE